MPKKPAVTNIRSGNLFITATFNNTLATITDLQGKVVCWGSTGHSGFKGARKSTPFAATTAIEATVRKAKEMGLTSLQVFIKGPGSGRDAVLGVMKTSGLKITQLADITPIPHNGCRPRKRRHG
ncbi:MAG: Ribosomal protein S11 [Candidatus Beckwithbacteria bacterium GW2011_GWA2_43_10]|uniref:Small ribosomal subunit protein uS11 n=1 Tax=Candidatus Beckwithbacteria bacterium GW2011_GWA2_43_10 TaxID=1618369 RepID=A0A0G1EC57_9BACT|nr:MAG: Ribosomal protein S11 [Candidatus Beckwithbacteria bacterium GW2011_GWA2_43_10]